MSRLTTTITLASILVVGASACGSTSNSATATSSAPKSSVPATSAPATSAPATSVPATSAPATSPAASTITAVGFNAADETFAERMIPHHQQAVAMADLALAGKADASAAVKDLAARIKGAQGPEIGMMQGWLTMWGAPMMTGATTPMVSAGEMPMNSTATSATADTPMDGMMSAADLASLAAASGTSFDTMWLTMMVEHHHGAITMSMTEQQSGANPDAKTLAGTIINAQNAEIAEMNTLLGT